MGYSATRYKELKARAEGAGRERSALDYLGLLEDRVHEVERLHRAAMQRAQGGAQPGNAPRSLPLLEEQRTPAQDILILPSSLAVEDSSSSGDDSD